MITASPPGPTSSPPPIPVQADAAELGRLGIVRVSTEHFEVGPYRYARLGDALIQARRGRIAQNDP